MLPEKMVFWSFQNDHQLNTLEPYIPMRFAATFQRYCLPSPENF